MTDSAGPKPLYQQVLDALNPEGWLNPVRDVYAKPTSEGRLGGLCEDYQTGSLVNCEKLDALLQQRRSNNTSATQLAECTITIR
jgi:hypothetical protein